MSLFGRGETAPMLAAEEQARGDNLASRIVELDRSSLSVGLHQLAVRDAYSNAARYTEQPEDRP